LRWLALVLVLLIVGLQYPMWLGKGGWLQVRDLTRSIEKEREGNAKLKARNEALDADVRDLKTGFEAIEERARAELGMVRQDEVFFQLQAAPQGKPEGDGPLARKSDTASVALKPDRSMPPANASR
jgi:cell division protein FtsB